MKAKLTHQHGGIETISSLGDITEVTLTNSKTGLTARGASRRYSQDPYDFNIGYNLARARALGRLARKLERHWANQF